MSVLFFVDISHSVLHYRDAYAKMVSKCVALLKTYRPDTLFSLIFFNQTPRYVCKTVPITSVPANIAQSLVPSGTTAIYDSVGKVLEVTPPSSGPGLVIILTDGTDTSSTSSLPEMTYQISMAKAKGYKIIYLGTTFYAMHIGRQFGSDVNILYHPNASSFQTAVATLEKILAENITKGEYDASKMIDDFANMSMG